jgi:RimJ/RimL family protein N-acetyltransferase
VTAPGGLRTLPFDAHPIRTDRLLLRPLTAADADDVAAYQGLPEVVRYLPWPLRTPDESRGHTAQRAGFTRLQHDRDGLALAIELLGADGAPGPVIGDLSVILDSAEHARIALGWVLHPSRQGLGYATEAARAALELVFTEIGAHRVHAELDPRNAASAALCLRLGMRPEAHFVENELSAGGRSDLAVYAILRREWEAAR